MRKSAAFLTARALVILAGLSTCGLTLAACAFRANDADKNKASAERYWDDVLTKENYKLIPTLLSPNYTYNGRPSSVADNEALVCGLHKRFPGLKFTIESILAEGEKVALRWRLDAPVSGSRPAGYLTGTNILIFEGGSAVANNQDETRSGLGLPPLPAADPTLLCTKKEVAAALSK